MRDVVESLAYAEIPGRLSFLVNQQRNIFPRVIRAFARVRAELEPCLLIIAGPDDGELAPLQALAGELGLRDSVRLTGPLYSEEKLSCYVDADVLASPAVHEIFGLVPLEALMCGTPVVVTDDCGSGSLVAEAGAGSTVPYGDVDALGVTLLRVLRSPSEATQHVQSGQAYIRERLSWDAVLANQEGVYKEAIRCA